MSTGYFGKRSELELTNLFSGLINANHILHNHGVLDGYGHASVRNPDNKETFFMSYSIAPALVSSPDDLVEYKVEDGEAVDSESKKGFLERFIHSELYKKFPAVNCVVHSHCPEVLPFGVSGVPLKPVIHMAGFLGPEVPVWDISSAYSSSDKHDMLVSNTKLGASLAKPFAKANTSAGFIYGKLTSAVTGAKDGPSDSPDHPAVLMRGHGFTVAGSGIEEVVYMAIYTKEGAKAQAQALLLSNAYFESKLEGKIPGGEAGGSIKGGKIKKEGELHFLDAKELGGTFEMMQNSMLRPWQLWVREVEVNPLYVNDSTKEG